MLKTMSKRSKTRAVTSAKNDQRWHITMMENFQRHADRDGKNRSFYESLVSDHQKEIDNLSYKIKKLLIHREVDT